MLIPLVAFWTTALSCQTERTCTDFRTGVFESPDTQVSDIKIFRNDSLQIEVSERRNLKDIYRIMWSGDCTYKLVLLKTRNPEQTFVTQSDTLIVNITAIEGERYRYEAFLNGKQFTGDLKQTDKQITNLITD